MGGDMGKGGGSQQVQYVPQSQTTVTSPWTEQQPYLKQIFSGAESAYQKPLESYGGDVPGVPTGQTYAPFSPQTKAAMEMVQNTALNDPVVSSATDFSKGMLSGDFLSAGNPYFANMMETVGDTIIPQVESTYSKSGRYGSGSMDNALTSALANTGGQLAYQNYSNVLDQMGKALYTAPQTSALEYTPAQQLATVGGMTEDQTQNAINQAMQNWQFSQMEPWQRLGLFGNEVIGNYGGVSNTAGYSPVLNPSMNNNLVGNIGGALTSGAGLGMLAYSLFGSDIRLKKNVRPVEVSATKLIQKINPVTFDYKPEFGNSGHIGFVADELEKIAPNSVVEINGYKHITPIALITILIKAVQEQQVMIDELRNIGTVKNLHRTSEE